MTETLNPIEAQQKIWDEQPPSKEELAAMKVYLTHIKEINFIKQHYPSLLNVIN